MIDKGKLVNFEAEEGLIGSVLVNPSCYCEISKITSSNDFGNLNNKNAWIAFQNIKDRGLEIDLITASDELSKIDHLSRNEANSYFLDLLNKTPTSQNAFSYAKIIREFSIRRAMINASGEFATKAFDLKTKMKDLLELESYNVRFFRELIEINNPKNNLLDSKDAYKQREPIDWIVENLFAQETINILVGDGGTKKTYIAIWLGVRVSNGLEFLGYKTKKSKVLYIDEEMGEVFFLDRVWNVEEGSNTFAENPMQIKSCAGYNLTKSKDFQAIEDLIIENETKLVILDAFSSLMGGLDENLSKETSPFFLNLRQICKNTKCAFLIIHHTNKKNSYRGSTDIKSKVDLMLQINSKDSSNVIEFKSVKVRNGKPLSFKGLCYWNDGKFWITKAKKDCPDILSNEENYVVNFLRENGETKRASIHSSTKEISQKSLDTAIYSLMGKNIIYRTNPDEKGRGKEAKYNIR